MRVSSPRHFNTGSWTDEEVTFILQCAKKKYKAHEISSMMVGRTARAIIGKLNRLNVQLSGKKAGKRVTTVKAPAKEKPERLFPKEERPSVKGQKQPGLHLDTKYVPENPKTLMELKPRQCKQPVKRNDEGEWLMCAQPQSFDSPYCRTHYHENYKPR